MRRRVCAPQTTTEEEKREQESWLETTEEEQERGSVLKTTEGDVMCAGLKGEGVLCQQNTPRTSAHFLWLSFTPCADS